VSPTTRPEAPTSLRERRFAANQTVFRRANERLSRVVAASPSADALYVCECGDASCTELISLLRAEYEHVRSSATWFLITPGHELLGGGAEQVVETHEHHQVVEKYGAAGAVAEATATRSSPDVR